MKEPLPGATIPRGGAPPGEPASEDHPLRILCLIDSLDQGGAQRQLSLLAARLACRGHAVEVLTYLPKRFFDPAIETAGVSVHRLPRSGRLRRILAIRRALRARRPDVVLAYLNGPALYAELAGLPRRCFGLIVVEFSLPGRSPRLRERLRWAGHLLADAVVTETGHFRRQLAQAAPWLAGRTRVIRNGVDLGAFRPRRSPVESRRVADGVSRVLVLARYAPEKNPFGMLAAIGRVRQAAPEMRVKLDWYGSAADEDNGLYRALKTEVRERGLEDMFRLHGPVTDCAALYREASLVCLPSFYEGCSNVICEAAASGVPLIVSDVCDNRRFVLDGVTGFLADPHAPETFADAILRFHRLPAAARQQMGQRARAHAEELFDLDRFANDYEALIRRVARRGNRRREPAR